MISRGSIRSLTTTGNVRERPVGIFGRQSRGNNNVPIRVFPSMNKRLVTVSKFLSKYLRHEPEGLGLTLDVGGWVLVSDLLAGAARQGFVITNEELREVVAQNDKQRFALDETGTRIRAKSGSLDRGRSRAQGSRTAAGAISRHGQQIPRRDPDRRSEEDGPPRRSFVAGC